MHNKNFIELCRLPDKQGHIRKLGELIQDSENQLWEGHPHIYPNLRVFLEALCDVIIKFVIKIEINETPNGMTRDEIHNCYNTHIRQKDLVKFLTGKKLDVKRDAWSYSLKLRTIAECFEEKGISTKYWYLNKKKPNDKNNLQYWLNDRAHIHTPIFDDRKKAADQFESRFKVLKVLHDGMYKDLMEKVWHMPVKPYYMPTNDELETMVNKYFSGFRE